MKPFLDSIDPIDLPIPSRRLVTQGVIPALIGSLALNGVEAWLSCDLEPVVEMHNLSGGEMPLFQLFNPRFQLDVSPSTCVVIVAMRARNIIATVGCRRKWVPTTLAEEMESLRIYYADPAAMAAPGERCVVGAPLGRSIKSCYVAFSGGGFVSRPERGRGTYRAMTRLLGVWTAAHWRFSWSVGLARPKTAFALGFDAYGYSTAEPRVYRLVPGQRYEDREYWLLAASSSYWSDTFLAQEAADLGVPLRQLVGVYSG
ncbi:MAG: hypothetical protein ACLQME_14175 [Alphaproteobacteria bacterium]